jgi:hypothetical protein
VAATEGNEVKVYGVNLDGRYRGIVAATSMEEAARIWKTTLHHARNFGCETGNLEECEIALREPRRAWKKSYAINAKWEPMR